MGMRETWEALSGVGHPEERVLLIAHYDTVPASPGADDNTSGVAVLLELARCLQGAAFDRTIQFVAVNLEESQTVDGQWVGGLRGSRALAETARGEGWQLTGVVVLESVAYGGSDISQKPLTGLPVPMPEKGDFIAVVGNQASAALVKEFVSAASTPSVGLPCLPLVVPGNGEVLRDTRRSDHAPFWDAGFKAIMLTDTCNFRNPHYHQPTDTLSTLNLDFTTQVCRATGLAVARLAGVSE